MGIDSSLIRLFLLSASLLFGGFLEAAIREDFENLDQWVADVMRGAAETGYAAVDLPDGSSGVLRIESKDSASFLCFSKNFNPAEWPIMRWRWRVDELVSTGEITKKSGDDFSIRIAIVFPYDRDRASWAERIEANLYRAATGRYPPSRAIYYVWGNHPRPVDPVPSPYSQRIQIFFPRSGPEQSGQWWLEERNIREDFLRVFGEEMPTEAKLCVMGDTDNSKGSSLAYLDWISLEGE